MYLSHIIKNFNILSNSQISNFSQSDYFYEDLKMFKTQVESQAASECFHCFEHFDITSMVIMRVFARRVLTIHIFPSFFLLCSSFHFPVLA